MTQSELTSRIEVSKLVVTSYEQVRTSPSIEVLIKLCETLDISSDYMLGISNRLPNKMNAIGLSQEEIHLLLQFLNLVEQNRTTKNQKGDR